MSDTFNNVLTREGDRNVYTNTYFSLDEYAAAAESRLDESIAHDGGDAWSGDSMSGALEMARSGWTAELKAALAVAESAVKYAESEHLVEVFTPVWDVAGAEVDVARYLSGEPENMIDYPMLPTSKVGKVITLCASVCYSSAVDAESIKKRGQMITALAIALGQLGHSTELWADVSIRCYDNKNMSRTRVLVKGANDIVDPARILYAYAHPSMLRRLAFAVVNGCKKIPRGERNAAGMPEDPKHDLPDGTIYLPSVTSSSNIPDMDVSLKHYLGELGLLAE